jgi:beta-lactam-binding protein with PASTA domain
MTRKTPVPPEAFADQFDALPAAGDRVRLVGLDYAMRLQNGRQGAASRRLLLVEARRPDAEDEIAVAESAVRRESVAAFALQSAVGKAETPIPPRQDGLYILHGRVVGADGGPAPELTVSAITADGRVVKFTCTDANGAFRLDIAAPKPGEDAPLPDAVFLQVSDADQAVLYRGKEAFEPQSGEIVYREIRLGGAPRKPCPPPPEGAEMPNLIGLTEARATAVITGRGLVLAKRSTQPDPERVGLVISQEPQAGAPIQPGDNVAIVVGVAEPSDTVEVPSLIRLTEEEARKTLKTSGLVAGEVGTAVGAPVGRVIEQKPQAGAAVQPGSAVDFVVAVAPPVDLVEVPDLVGMKLEEARGQIAETSLALGRVELRDDDRVGIVLAQEPSANTKVAKETQVSLVVGRETTSEKTRVPQLKGESLESAAKLLDDARLKLGKVSGDRTGQIASQSPAAGDSAAVGTPVAVTMGKRTTGGGDTRSGDLLGRLGDNLARTQGFESLGVQPLAIVTRLREIGATSPEKLEAVLAGDNAAIRDAFGLGNLNKARSFRRIAREALEAAQRDADG